MKPGFVYILSNKNNATLYTGVTSDMVVRIKQHKEKLNSKSFTAKYNLNKPMLSKDEASKYRSVKIEKVCHTENTKRNVTLSLTKYRSDMIVINLSHRVHLY